MGWFSLLSLLFFLLPFSSFQTSSNVSSSSIIHHPSPLCHPYERSALIQFKNSFSVNNTFASFYYDYECDGIDPPTVSWAKNDASNCCAWRGVTCDEKAGHVIGLDLSCARLRGAFHSNSTLFFLRNLQSLHLSQNDFGGSTIPSEFGKFTNLEHLILRDSNFSGNVPPEISYLSKLVTLDLSLNNFHKLNVDTFTLKRIVTNLTNLEALYLSQVDMSSVSPVVLMNLSSSLINLTLSGCSLGGNLPADYIFHLPKLEMLSLFGNENLTGSMFPKSNRNTSSPLKGLFLSMTKLSIDFPYLIQNFKYSLEYLYIRSCKILGWNPTLLANLTQISWLFLGSNNLGGEIPWSSLMHLERLIELDLSDNNFTGQLPEISSYNSTQLSFSYDNSSNSLTSGGPLPLELESLYLFDNLLDGKIPGWLYSLKSLENLDLSSNQFTGYIEEFQFHSLVSLDLSNNKLRGSLPSSIFQQVNLTFLDLSSNSLSGDVGINDFSKLKRLKYLSISKNQLSGEIPSSICDLNSLKYLDLSNNSLIGTVHPCLGNFSVNLLVLNLHINKLHGTIPLTFAKGNSLRNLNLNGNQLGGILPQSLVRCKKMEILDVGNNKMNDTFPYWLESLPMLQVLILRSNRFHGSIEVSPKTAHPFRNLRIMDLSDNEFSGNLPTKYFKNLLAMMDAHSDRLKYMGEDPYYESTIVVIKGVFIELVKIQTMFTTIDLSKNNFEGEIPKMIGKLKSLKGLNFSHNKLTGPIPSTLENLSNLECLDLSWNELVGEIPQQLTNMISLEVLNVSKNRLVGPIPSGKQFNTFDNTSYSENVGLCGFPLSKICGNNEVPQSPTTKFEEEGGYGFDWKIILVGYGCGIVIGVSLGYIVLSNEKFTLFLIKIGFSNLLYA